jgi:hypothetical protein
MGDIVNDERCSLDPVLSTQAQLIIHENLDLFPMNYRSGAAKKTASSDGKQQATDSQSQSQQIQSSNVISIDLIKISILILRIQNKTLRTIAFIVIISRLISSNVPMFKAATSFALFFYFSTFDFSILAYISLLSRALILSSFTLTLSAYVRIAGSEYSSPIRFLCRFPPQNFGFWKLKSLDVMRLINTKI